MTKDDLDRLYAQACEAEQVWLEDDEDMRLPPPTVLDLIQRVRELEAKFAQGKSLVLDGIGSLSAVCEELDQAQERVRELESKLERARAGFVWPGKR